MLTQADKLARARDMREQVGTIDPDAPALLSELYPTVSASMTETEQVRFERYTPEWEPDTEYKKCQTVMRDGQLYRVSQDHTSSDVYPPETAGESLYYPITVAPDGIIVYRMCHGEYDMVRKGELRHYPDADGPVYEALEDTAYSPDVYPQHWKKVEGGEDPDPEEPVDEWPEYVQPTGAHDAYHTGDKVTWQGGRYVCTAPEGVACVWDPGTYPAYWEMQ